MKNKERIVEYTIVHNGEKEIMDLPLLLHSNRKSKSDDDTQLMIEQDDLKFVRSKGLNNYIIGDFEVTYLIFPIENIDSIPPFKLKVSVDDLEKYSSNISQHHSSVNYETGEVIYSDFNLSNLPLNKMSLWLNTPFRKNEVIKIKIKYIRMETKENKPEEVVGQDQSTQDFQSEQGVSIPEISDESTTTTFDEGSIIQEQGSAESIVSLATTSDSAGSEQGSGIGVNESIEPNETLVVERNYANKTTEQAVNTTSDAVVFGDGDMWKLLCKFSSQSNRVMKSTKALEIKMVGCLVQVTTVENGVPSEAITFVPNTVIVEDKDEKGNVINRRLEASPYAVR
jgi:hypothetical protein